MSEANFWKEIKKNVGHVGHWSRIESHATADGFPDTVFTKNDTTAFIELKQEDDETKTPHIRPSQVRWFRREVRNGGNCWLFSKIGNTYLLHKGYHVGFLHTFGIELWKMHAEGQWENNVDWDEFIKCISQ